MSNKNCERVACYIRVSTQEQKIHGISLSAQRDKLTEYTQKHNLKIIEWYEDEGISGTKLIKNRPALQRMLLDAKDGKFDRILFIKLDRFFRSVAEYHECMKLITPVIWTATEEKYDLSTANGRAFVNMKLTIAELEADQTGERIKIVNDYKVKTGQPLTGSVPYGYTIATVDNTKRIIKDGEKAEIVKDVINHYITYQSKRKSLTYLNTKYGYTMPYNSFTRLLKNTLLYGSYRGNDNYINDPIIDKNTFDLIQSILAKNIKRPPNKYEYIFTGLVKCPVCGNNLSSKFSNQKWIKKTTQETKYYLSVGYVCNSYVSNHKCTFKKYVSEKTIEKKLIDKFNDYVSAHINVETIESVKALKKENEIKNRVDSIKNEMDKLRHLYLRDDITEATFDYKMDNLKAELSELTATKKDTNTDKLDEYKKLLESDWINIYNALNKENKRAFWRKYINKICINEDKEITDIFFN